MVNQYIPLLFTRPHRLIELYTVYEYQLYDLLGNWFGKGKLLLCKISINKYYNLKSKYNRDAIVKNLTL